MNVAQSITDYCLVSSFSKIASDQAVPHPLLHGRATVGAVLHLLRARATRALMAARHGEVRLWIRHTNNACRLATDCGLRNNVPAGNVANISERQHRLRWSRRLSVPPRAARRYYGRRGGLTTAATPAVHAMTTATCCATAKTR